MMVIRSIDHPTNLKQKLVHNSCLSKELFTNIGYKNKKMNTEGFGSSLVSHRVN